MKCGSEALEAAAGLIRFVGNEIQPVRDALGRDDIGHPSVAESRGALESRLSTSTYPNRRTAGSRRLRQHRHFAEAEILAPILDRLTRPQPLDDLDSFIRAAAALLHRNAACFILGRKFAAHSDAENKMTRAHQAI